MKQIVFPLLLLALLGGCSTPLSKILIGDQLAAGDYQIDSEFRFQWRNRTAHLHVPPGLDSHGSYPLVIILHGAFSTGKQTAIETGFNEMADQDNFLVAYPEGIGLFRWLQHWNAGHCCGKAADDKIDDVGFVMSVVDKLARELPVDSSRIYLAGMSNGGMLTYRILAEKPGRFAAAAVVAGVLGSRPSDAPERKPQAPHHGTPLIIFHGDADQHIPPAGGVSPLARGDRIYNSLDDAIEFWRRANECSENIDEQSFLNGNIQRQVWDGCRHDLEVWQLADWGHQWPGHHFTSRLPTDSPLYGFDSSAEVWKFFRRHTRTMGNHQ